MISLQLRIDEGVDRIGNKRYTNVSAFADQSAHPGHFVFIKPYNRTEFVTPTKAEVLGWSPTLRPKDTFRFEVVTSS